MKQDDIIREIDRLARNIVGVQPMTGYVGKIFTIKHKVTPKPKYQFSRAKWYEAEFNIEDFTDVVHWCTEQFGPHPAQQDAWSRWDHRYEGRIYFRDEKDYIWFTLRWS